MLKILIVDDHPIFRMGLKQVMADNTDFIISDEASNGEEAQKKVSKNKYDMVLLDISLPDKNGLDVLRDLNKQSSSLPIIMLSMYKEEQYAMRAFRDGASGYVTKESTPEELINAILQVSSGDRYVSPSLKKVLMPQTKRYSKKLPHESLSFRESQVMAMIVEGKTVKEIATELRVGQGTIRTYRCRIRHKIGVHSDLEMMRYAVDNHLVK